MQKEIIINGNKFIPFIDKNSIEEAVMRISGEINQDYSNKKPVFLIVLKGAFIFAADLIRSCNMECEVEVINAKSYGAAMESSGNVRISNFDFEIKGKDVIIIEDIIDTGITLKALSEAINEHHPASLEICVLLSKPSMRKVEVSCKYLGLEIPDKFVIGYGLDYDGRGRNLPEIYILDK
ncbi:MAG: hypoxanthine phosphoribosyltransferase [Ignavibacteria bacterium]|nr:hypoxanthine phosphoribosyltransferase [Ignavibacteria bacterium]